MSEETKTLVDQVQEYQKSPEADPWKAIIELAKILDTIIDDVTQKPE